MPNRSSKRWLMISLAFFATVINYLDRQTLSVVAPVLLDEFNMSSIDYSRVLHKGEHSIAGGRFVGRSSKLLE